MSDTTAPRTWRPEQKARDEVMNQVLEILLAHEGELSQKQITVLLYESLAPGVKYGTCAAYVSASLLHFAEAGWVVTSEKDSERSPIWRVV